METFRKVLKAHCAPAISFWNWQGLHIQICWTLYKIILFIEFPVRGRKNFWSIKIKSTLHYLQWKQIGRSSLSQTREEFNAIAAEACCATCVCVPPGWPLCVCHPCVCAPPVCVPPVCVPAMCVPAMCVPAVCVCASRVRASRERPSRGCSVCTLCKRMEPAPVLPQWDALAAEERAGHCRSAQTAFTSAHPHTSCVLSGFSGGGILAALQSCITLLDLGRPGLDPFFFSVHGTHNPGT